ncbi:MAG: PQQ-dependent catabolism-associated CXXCW motif protein [Candidatus Thiodiazotropha sp.]
MKRRASARCSIERLLLGAALLLLAGAGSNLSAAADENTQRFSADGYRIDEFRSPVPDTVPAGTTLDTEQLQSLLKDQEVVLIDVLPAPIKPKDRPANLLWLPPDRYNIPGSHWLPNVGYGALSTELERYFKENLRKLSGGDKAKKIVFYCLANCWMSWNAARRAAKEFGYTRIYWYPDGTTGWEAAGMSLEKCEPVGMDEP